MTKIEFSDTTTSFVHLAEELHDNVTILVLRNVKITGDDPALCDFWRVLRGHPCLTEFSWCNVTFEDPDADLDRLIGVLFVSCPKITRVVIDNMRVPVSAIKSAEYCTTLRELTLSNDHFEDADATVIAEALARNTHIEKVDFRGNDLTEQGGKAFEARVSLNKSIQQLSLGAGGEAQPKGDKLRRQNSATAA